MIAQPFKTLWNNRSLAVQITQRVVLTRTRGSYLGILWQLLTPLFMMSLYTFVFGYLLQGSFHPDDNESPLLYGLGIYIGLAYLGLFTDTFNQATIAITSHPNMVKKVVFPLHLIPFAYFFTALLPSLVGLIIALSAIFAIQGSVPFEALYIPLIYLPMAGIALGLSWILAAFGVYLRDLSHFMQILSQLAFWTSGIFFSASILLDYPVLWNILKWNPILHAIDQTRSLLLWNTPLDFQWIFYLYALAIAFFYVGYSIFNELKSGFADVI
jgi:lipopolysaccharide transport system permease protein